MNNDYFYYLPIVCVTSASAVFTPISNGGCNTFYITIAYEVNDPE